MPNLDQIRQLNQQYGKRSPVVRETKLFAINEAIDPDKIEKAITDTLASMGPAYAAYFDMGLPADVALLFIDVCSFSTRFGHLDGDGISTYFDAYYDQVIPIIYKHGGEIDKVIGDGIICIFGSPFLNEDLSTVIEAADQCAKEIIKVTAGTDYSTKIAFHCGTINYFKNKTGLYKEFTMIGKPLTELFRLETICLDERVNYYGGTEIHKIYAGKIARFQARQPSSGKADWTHTPHDLPPLKGVNFTTYHTIQQNK